jgi:ATP-binding cassette, subfamily B (MDR/TAP), member 1
MAAANFMRLVNVPSVSKHHQEKTPSLDTDIVFDRVTFAYDARPTVPVLRDMSFRIRKGETVAIVGATGSGKSTIAALLQHLYEPDHGTIWLQDVDELGRARDSCKLRNVLDEYLHDNTAVISQHPNMLEDTITANISYGSHHPSDKYAIQNAARAACAEEFIGILPKGYNTVIGENGSQLSGGQVQRLQIARAFYSRPAARIRIFDECTSALDPKTEALVLNNLFTCVSQGFEYPTTIIITHRISVMQRCPRILVVENGKIAEEGTYRDLLNKGGAFSRLANTGVWNP